MAAKEGARKKGTETGRESLWNVNRGKLNRFRLPMSNSIKSVLCVGTTMRNDCHCSPEATAFRNFKRLNFIDFLMLTQNACLDKPKWLFRGANSTIKCYFFSIHPTIESMSISFVCSHRTQNHRTQASSSVSLSMAVHINIQQWFWI